MIKQRIRDELWDDVERKVEDKDPKTNRELDEVSTEKSKVGLGDIYAKEYEENVLGNKSAKDIEKQKLYDEITGIWNELSSKLDAMSNYHFTPKPVVEDIQIKSNVSSIQMEEVLPMGVSAASRFAPEEVFRKKRGREGVLIGEDEFNDLDSNFNIYLARRHKQKIELTKKNNIFKKGKFLLNIYGVKTF